MSQTFEERVTGSLDALFDGASLMTGDASRAEALVVNTVVDASRRYRRRGDVGEFADWILRQLVRRYLGFVEDDPEEARDPGERSAAARPSRAAFPDAALDSAHDDLDILMRRLRSVAEDAPDALSSLIRRELERLPLRERIAVWLVNVIELQYRPAAAALDIQVPELRELLARGRRELHARVAVALRAYLDGGHAALSINDD